ncbi:MAG: DNA alkylation repair protein [Candidatus Woesearchaeota archaeon]
MRIEQVLKKLENKKQAKLLQGFFKTGNGQYGEGDIFLGIKVPEQRKVAKKYLHLSIKQVEKLLHSKIHEHRLTALIIWTYQFKEADEKTKEKIYKTYLKNTKWINNWDLVDVTCNRIVGFHLLDRDRKILYKLAKSKNIWEKRIAIVSTGVFIVKRSDFKDTIKISEILMNDSHDLIHKAVGWMLREMGKKDEKALTKFLDKYHKTMPRTMLRYSLERLSDSKKKFYMQK